MTSSLLLIAFLIAVIFLWFDGARAREIASAAADEFCRRREYQLLDETVALTRAGLGRTADGLRIRRVFRFDYSIEGAGRDQGHILLYGSQVTAIHLPEAENPEERTPTAQNPAKEKGDDNVIPFRKRH